MKEEGWVHCKVQWSSQETEQNERTTPTSILLQGWEWTGGIAAEGWKESEDGLRVSKDKA